MTVRKLRLLSILAVVLFVLLLEAARQAFYPQFDGWGRRLALDGLVAAGFLVFLVAAFRWLEKLQGELERRDHELLALHAAALDMHRNLALEGVLQRVVDHARQLVGARYGALSVIGEDNRIRSFITSGVSPEERRTIGDPPSGRGLLGVVLHQGRHLRLPDIASDPRSAGFPANHPPMRSLLAVPIPALGGFRGNLYLTEKQGGLQFSEQDEETLTRFAVAASNAIDSAALHEKLSSVAVVEERMRIARELHDGMAQVLAYVNAKAQAVQEFLRSGRSAEAEAQLEQLASAAREVYADAREGILGLRSGLGPDTTLGGALSEYASRWREQSQIDVSLHGVDGARPSPLGPVAELQLLRIVQEALANVRKHSGARQVEITLELERTRVRATVADDGRGFDPHNISRRGLPRFGLATMRERAEAAGGHVQIDSTPGAGTRVSVEFPLDTTT